jgi:hypothetical protein
MTSTVNRKPVRKPVKVQKKSYKFATIKREAEKKAAAREPRKEIPPFVLDDIQPPIVITAPDTLERQMIIAELMGPDGVSDPSSALPLLRALCGDQFGRVWSLMRHSKDPEILFEFIQALFDHFSEVIQDMTEAEELPGGAEGSSE